MSKNEKALERTEEDYTKQALAALSPQELESQGYTTEIFHKLEQGEHVSGEYVGPGANLEFTNEKTGEVSPVGTWKIKNGPATVRIMGSYDLDQFFKGVPNGHQVYIRHLGQKNVGAFRVNQYEKWSKAPAGASKAVEA